MYIIAICNFTIHPPSPPSLFCGIRVKDAALHCADFRTQPATKQCTKDTVDEGFYICMYHTYNAYITHIMNAYMMHM